MLVQVDKTGLPPFLEKICRSANWDELVAEVLPEVDFQAGKRLTAYATTFDDPVVCRLYEGLYRARRQAFVRKIAEEFYAHCHALPDDAHILEVGCGPGIVLLELAQLARKSGRRWRFTGYDPSVEMIHIAHERLAEAQLQNVRFVCTSAAEPEGSELLKQTSVVLVRNVLSWFADPDQELASWRQYLCPGTPIISREVRRDIPLHLLKKRFVESCRFVIDGQVFYYPPKEYLAAFLRAFTPQEHAALLERHFQRVEHLTPHGALQADEGHIEQVEMEMRCHV